MLNRRGAQIDKVLNFAIDDSVLEERITGRWIHSSSGRSYHTKFAPPKVPGVDDVKKTSNLILISSNFLTFEIFVKIDDLCINLIIVLGDWRAIDSKER